MKTTDAPTPYHVPEPVFSTFPEDDGPDELVGIDKVLACATIARGVINEAMDTLPDLRREEDDEDRRLELYVAQDLAAQAWQHVERLITTLQPLRTRPSRPRDTAP